MIDNGLPLRITRSLTRNRDAIRAARTATETQHLTITPACGF
jgi:hypothetical protein